MGTGHAVREWQIAPNSLQNMLLHCQFPVQSLCVGTGVKMGQDSLIYLVCSSSDHRRLLCCFSVFLFHRCFQRTSLSCALLSMPSPFWAALCKNSLDWGAFGVHLDDSCWERRYHYLLTPTAQVSFFSKWSWGLRPLNLGKVSYCGMNPYIHSRPLSLWEPIITCVSMIYEQFRWLCLLLGRIICEMF